MQTLIVDDSRMMRMMLKNIVVKLNHKTTEAADGKQALACLKEHGGFDYMLLDWNMPNMNGLEVLKAVRNDTAYDPMMVLMVTTEAEIDHMRQALALGANDYIMKPFTDESVIEKIEMLHSEGLT